MARWGEGDPRWIVEERPDATNVNNWHWTEKNADKWSKDKLKELLIAPIALEREKNGDVVDVCEMSRCEGEARANNRKAKLIFFYEWEIDLKWKMRDAKGSEVCAGKVTIPNLSEEHTDMSDVDLEVSVDSGGSAEEKEKRAAKEFLRVGDGAAELRRRLQAYVSALKEEYSKGLILETKSGVASSKDDSTSSTKTAMQNMAIREQQAAGAASATKSSSSAAADFETISFKERFKCTGQELYNVLTQREMLQIFTSAPVNMSDAAKAGATFELLNGNIQGEFVELTPYSKLVLKWRLKNWPPSHFSRVTMNIEQSKEDTTLTVKQEKVPRKDVESTRHGWKVYYWEAIRRAFGFGSALF